MSTKNRMLLLAEQIARKLVAEQTQARIMLGFDAALIAAHEALGMGPGRAAAFSQAYHEAMEELAGLYVDDCDENGDKHIDYAKGKRDALIRRIVGDENFVPFDRAYGEAYMDELLDDCPFCGRHTAVKRCTIEKGETDSHASVRTGSE